MVYRRFILVAVFMGALVSACGGGGGASTVQGPPPGSVPSKILSWTPPSSFTDSTPLNPPTDLDGFEIYVGQDASFGPGDQVFAYVSPTDTTFDLAQLSPFLSPGVTYYVSMKSVALTGVKSDFSSTATFSF